MTQHEREKLILNSLLGELEIYPAPLNPDMLVNVRTCKTWSITSFINSYAKSGASLGVTIIHMITMATLAYLALAD